MKKDNRTKLSYQVKFVRGIETIEQLHQWFDVNSQSVGLAFVGRSNVGKSSLLNGLFGSHVAHVSKSPGRTRQINIFEFSLPEDHDTKFFVIDLPGYGHAHVSKQTSKSWDYLMSEFFTYLPEKIFLLVIWDARHPEQKMDKEFYQMLKDLRLDSFLIFNKMDKLKNQKEKSAFKKNFPILAKKYKKFKLVHFVSAETDEGMEELVLSLKSNLWKRTLKEAPLPN